MTRLVRAALLGALLATALPGVARANGDPASHVLPTQDVYFPSTGVSPAWKETLTKVAAQARAARFPMKVALIYDAQDLGTAAQTLSDPQAYTRILAPQLAFNERPRVLVVMKAGFGGDNLGQRVDEALRGLDPSADGPPDVLARVATVAVARLATLNGHRVPVPPLPPLPKGDSEDDEGGTSPVIYLAPLLLVVLGVGLATWHGRRRPDEPSEAPASPD